VLPQGLNEPGCPRPITLPKVLAVEGQSPFQFFKALLRHLGLLDKIEIRNYGGLQELPLFLQTLAATEAARKLESLGIIRDAESDAKAAFASVCSALQKARECLSPASSLPRLSVPDHPGVKTIAVPSVSIFILPDCVNAGMLEALCLESVKGDPAASCVDEYLACLNRYEHPLPANMAKARLHVFLASRSEPECLLGQAAHQGYFPWSSPVFDSIKRFLQAL